MASSPQTVRLGDLVFTTSTRVAIRRKDGHVFVASPRSNTNEEVHLFVWAPPTKRARALAMRAVDSPDPETHFHRAVCGLPAGHVGEASRHFPASTSGIDDPGHKLIGPSRFCRTLFQIERTALHSYGPDPHSC